MKAKQKSHWLFYLKLSSLITLTIILLSRYHIEWLWFSQFNLQSVLIKQIQIQVLCILISTIGAVFLIFWQEKWRKIISIKKSIVRAQRFYSGWIYTLSLLGSLIATNIALLIIILITVTSLVDPYSTYSWWTLEAVAPYKNVTLILIASINLVLFLNRSKGAYYTLITGCIGFIVSITRCWGIWALGLSIPNSNILEPVYQSDISFSLGIYPALILICTICLAILSLTLFTSLWIYLTTKSNLSDWQVSGLDTTKKNHIKPILILIILLIGSLFWLSRHEFLWTQNEIFAGASWLDINFSIPLRTLGSLSLFIFCLGLLISGTLIKTLIKISSYLLLGLALLLEFLIAPFLDWIIVKPRELELESKYIARAIKSTRKAFQLDSITTNLINPRNEISKSDIRLGESTLKNVRLWDSQPLLDTNRQLQQLRKYYRFSRVAVDRYKLAPDSAERQQVMITARELDSDELPERSRTWLNRHFVFTHGYGFTVSPVNTKANDGLPEYFIKDIGISSKIEGNKNLGISKEDVIDSIPIGQPAIYYGMLSSKYVVAPSKIKELDYPEGDKNIFNHYDGSGGITIYNLLNRLSAAFYVKDARLLNTGSYSDKSKILIRRGVTKRLKMLAPFLEFISDPYLISVSIPENSQGYDSTQNQYWIVEGYTSSTTYPYAEKINAEKPIRYIRNSVKAIVDAYNGSINLYITEPSDPIIQAWNRVFPGLFQSLSDMPTSIRDHLSVPVELFNIQVDKLLRYHVTDPRTFYNGDDIWQVPMEIYGSKEVPIQPYHITAQIGDNERSEFLLLQPLSPLARPNLSAWLAARNDGNNYGELVLLRFPSQTSIFGPEQIQALINQDPLISQQFSLWDRAGSEVIQGNLLVLPIGNSLLYVEPVYLKASTGGLPTLTRIVVSDGKRIAMAESLREGIDQLLKKPFDRD